MTKYLTLEEIIKIHKNLIDEFGGSPGILDYKILQSAVLRPQTGYYKDIIEEAAALMESLAMNHPFIDGNKRVAFFATDVFLRLNGFFIECDNEEAYHFFINLFNTKNFKFDKLHDRLQEKVRNINE
jgi:death-on-curing protein